MKKAIGVVLVLGVALGIVYYFTAMQGDALTERKQPAKAEPRGLPVLAATVERKGMPERIVTIGTVEPIASVKLRSRLDSAITSVKVKEGQMVKRGEVLFRLDARPTLAAVKQAEAARAKDQVQLTNAKRDLARMNERLNSRQQIDQARTAVEALQAVVRADDALVESARVQLAYTTIRSPIMGRLGAIALKEGNAVRAADSTPLVTINQMRPIYVSFAVPQQRLAAMRDAMKDGSVKVVATVPGDEAHPQTGKVAFVDNAIDPNTGTVKVKAIFDNPDERLWPGAHADVNATVRMQPNALVVPSQAIQQSQRGTLVFVIKDDMTVDTRLVTVDRNVGDEVVITKGLEPGEKVVVEGQLRLTKGAKVEVMSEPQEETKEEEPQQ